MEQKRLNPTVNYILSILGILCCCIIGSGIIPSAIAFFMANNDLKKVSEKPEEYDESSVKNMKTAKIIAIVAIVLNLLMIVRVIYVIATVGWDNMYDEFMRSYQQALEAQGQ